MVPALRLDRNAERAPNPRLLAQLEHLEHVPHAHVHVQLQAHRPPAPGLLHQLPGDVAADGDAAAAAAAGAPPVVELHLYDLAGLPALVEHGRGGVVGGRADDGVAEAELGVDGVVVDVDADAGVVEPEADGEVVGDRRRG